MSHRESWIYAYPSPSPIPCYSDNFKKRTYSYWECDLENGEYTNSQLKHRTYVLKKICKRYVPDCRGLCDCVDVLGEVLKYTNQEDILNILVLNKEIYSYFKEGRFSVYFYAEKERKYIHKELVNCKFIVNASIIIEFAWFFLEGNIERLNESNIQHLKLRHEHLDEPEQIYDFSQCEQLKTITIYNNEFQVKHFDIKNDGNTSIVTMKLNKFSGKYTDKIIEYYNGVESFQYNLPEWEKETTNTMTFIGYKPLKIIFYNDKVKHAIYYSQLYYEHYKEESLDDESDELYGYDFLLDRWF